MFKMRKIGLFLIASCLFLSACGNEKNKPLVTIKYEINEKSSQLEKVILNEMVTNKGLVKTDLGKRKNEYLSESQGLLMLYFVLNDDKENFNKSFQALKQSFLLSSNMLSWQIINGKQSQTNALIDDFRVIEALQKALSKWPNKEQQSFLNDLIEGNKKYSMNKGYFVDFGHSNKKERASEITLSYADPLAYQAMNLTSDQIKKNLEIIRNTPQNSNGFYAKKYELDSKSYQFDKDIHMVDQLLTAINIENAGVSTDKFHELIKQLVKKSGKLNGQYNHKTLEPLVAYESPAVYSYAILYSRLIKDKALEEELNNNLQKLKNTQEQSPYFGAFIEEGTKTTHSFDNLLPLIVEL